MKTTVNLQQFRQAFFDMGRHNQFSSDGLRVLFEALEQYEDETGEETELDVIALCCEYSENTPEQIAVMYDLEWVKEQSENNEEFIKSMLEVLNESTFVCGVTNSGTIIYQQF